MHCHVVHRQYMILCLQCVKLSALKFWKIMLLRFYRCNSRKFFSLCGTVRAYNMLTYRMFALSGCWNLIAKGIKKKTKRTVFVAELLSQEYWFNKNCWTFPVLKWCKMGEFQVHSCFAACIYSVCVTHTKLAWYESVLIHIPSFAVILLHTGTYHRFCKDDICSSSSSISVAAADLSVVHIWVWMWRGKTER
jgi:hypothetical protein